MSSKLQMTPTRRLFAEMLGELCTIKLDWLIAQSDEKIKYLSDKANEEWLYEQLRLR